MTNTYHPKFVEAVDALAKMSDHAKMNTPLGQSLMQQAMLYSPEELKRQFHQMADSMGLIPKTNSVDENGEPDFSSKQIADHYGVPESEVIDYINRSQAANTDFELHVKSINVSSKH